MVDLSRLQTATVQDPALAALGLPLSGGQSGWLCIYSPETLKQAELNMFSYASFTLHRKGIAMRIAPGDLLFPYVTGSKVLRGILKATSRARVDNDSTIYGVPGSYPVVLECAPLILLDSKHEVSLGLHLGRLALFRGIAHRERWASSLRVSPRSLCSADTLTLCDLIMEASRGPCQ
jgi:hypothetical protein